MGCNLSVKILNEAGGLVTKATNKLRYQCLLCLCLYWKGLNAVSLQRLAVTGSWAR